MRPLVALLPLLALTTPGTAQSCPAGRTALVLSGGGAKGLAHIGVLRVLDSLGIKPDVIVGTSMGAIIGGVYASGYSGREIDSLARALPLSSLFRSYEPRAPRSLGLLQPLIVWEQGEGRFSLQRAAVREAQINALFNTALLRGNLIARGDFDSLPIPFRAVATDLTTGNLVVLAKGDLARAVRASAAVPLVLEPERIDGRFLGDGALAANVPVEVARRAGASRILVSDATDRSVDSLALYSPLVLAEHLIDLLLSQPDDTLTSEDVRIRPEVDGFRSLDFSSASVSRLIGLGYEAASRALNDLQCRGSTPGRSWQYPRRLRHLRVMTGPLEEERSLRRLIGFGSTDTIEIPRWRAGLRRLGQSDTYTAIWFYPHGDPDSLELSVVPRYAPRRVAGLGLVYDNELGGRLWLGAVDRHLVRRGTEGSAAVFLGEFRKELYAGLRDRRLSRAIVTPTLTARIATESVRRFAPDGDEINSLEIEEAVGFLGIERWWQDSWFVALGSEGRAWDDPGRDPKSAAGLNLRVFKIEGPAEPVLRLEAAWTGIYRKLELEGAVGMRVDRLKIRPRVRYGLGDRLPPHLSLPLGGFEGFPGLHLGERRGDREALLGVVLTHPIASPALARVEVVVGRTANGGDILPLERSSVGVRAGLGADTPVGPIRFEYGWSGRRGAFFVRIGRWF